MSVLISRFPPNQTAIMPMPPEPWENPQTEIENMQKRQLTHRPTSYDTEQFLLERVQAAILEAMDITDGLDAVSARRYAEVALNEIKKSGALKAGNRAEQRDRP